MDDKEKLRDLLDRWEQLCDDLDAVATSSFCPTTAEIESFAARARWLKHQFIKLNLTVTDK